LTLLSNQQIANLGESYVDIRLEDLSPAETGTMVGSLLKTEQIPADLEYFLRDKAGGNPFYLEEIINSLVETKTLESAGQIGANATLGRAYRDWGRLYLEKGDTDKAAACFAQANTYLRLCGSEDLAEYVVDDTVQETKPDIAEYANKDEIINSHLSL
jgi:tetratricopeptide (TPR) repeat protein